MKNSLFIPSSGILTYITMRIICFLRVALRKFTRTLWVVLTRGGQRSNSKFSKTMVIKNNFISISMPYNNQFQVTLWKLGWIYSQPNSPIINAFSSSLPHEHSWGMEEERACGKGYLSSLPSRMFPWVLWCFWPNFPSNFQLNLRATIWMSITITAVIIIIITITMIMITIIITAIIIIRSLLRLTLHQLTPLQERGHNKWPRVLQMQSLYVHMICTLFRILAVLSSPVMLCLIISSWSIHLPNFLFS